MSASPKIALVTGAGTGVGRAVAIALAKAGYNLVLAGRRKEPLDAVAAEINAIGAQALSVPTDVSKRESILALFATVKSSFGRLDLLVQQCRHRCSESIPMEDFDLRAVGERRERQPDGGRFSARRKPSDHEDSKSRGGRIINNGSNSACAAAISVPTSTKHAITG